LLQALPGSTVASTPPLLWPSRKTVPGRAGLSTPSRLCLRRKARSTKSR
ncbi:hypothetical protein S7711_11590, partial [Stachybotrys chartarum IBT 7711]